MTSKLGKKYNMFYVDLMKCLNYYIDQNEFEDLWNCIIENDNYAETKSYLEVLRESTNSLLKGFIDCKTRLIEFLAAFECALYFRKEAEHISAYKELKFETEWSEKDAYACEEITDDNGVRCFKLSRYERPDVIHRVCYDSKVLACCCRNLEFAGIVCCHSLAVAVHLSLAQLDLVYFPKCWRKDLP
ncbi:16514_t:CDS:2, partial [Dentiscutata heterogama]